MNKDRVERKEITGATALNSVKTIKLFCEMNEILLPWKRITRGLPKARRYADDRAPTLEEIQRIVEYPDRRIKAIVCTMVSSGIRLGAWNYLKWKHITPIMREGKIVAAKISVYQGDPEQYFSFVTPEAFLELEKWILYRRECGEDVTPESWIMRNIWFTTSVPIPISLIYFKYNLYTFGFVGCSLHSLCSYLDTPPPSFAASSRHLFINSSKVDSPPGDSS